MKQLEREFIAFQDEISFPWKASSEQLEEYSAWAATLIPEFSR